MLKNIKLHVLGGTGSVNINKNTGTASLSVNIPKNIQQTIQSTGGGTGSSIVWGEVITTLEYPDAENPSSEGVYQYEVALLNDPSFIISPLPLSQEANYPDLINSPPDMRLFVPWYQVGDIVPLVTRSVTVGAVTETLYFFDLQMMRVAIELNGVQSIAWNKEEERVMSVFGDVETEFEDD